MVIKQISYLNNMNGEYILPIIFYIMIFLYAVTVDADCVSPDKLGDILNQ